VFLFVEVIFNFTTDCLDTKLVSSKTVLRGKRENDKVGKGVLKYLVSLALSLSAITNAGASFRVRVRVRGTAGTDSRHRKSGTRRLRKGHSPSAWRSCSRVSSVRSSSR
jgi:hypothetical protein